MGLCPILSMYMKSLLFFFITIFFTTSLFAIQDLKILSQNSTWKALLHYHKNQSEIINKRFFLSPQGAHNLTQELKATLDAYYQPFKNENHAICKYPARYLWLSKHINLPKYKILDKRCKRLNKWDNINDIDTIGVVYVSGFLGNPASAFGHSFIRLNKKENPNPLLSHSIAFGAKLPKKYTMVSYIYNGLSGGYTGSYTDKYYYMDDLVYSNKEFREMWEYELILNVYEKSLLLLHLWELRGQKFVYYFLNRNCGYRISELLELVKKDPIIKSANIWYAPSETFFKLKALNRGTSKKAYHTINYIPSIQQNIYEAYHKLNKQEKMLLLQYLQGNAEAYKNLNREEQIKLLDATLHYLAYLNSDKSYKKNKQLQEIYKSALTQRIQLPAFTSKEQPQKLTKREITDNVSTTSLALNLHHKGIQMQFTPFGIDSIDYNTLDGDILSVLKTSLYFTRKGVDIDTFDLIKVRRLATDTLPIDIESPFSWSLHMGTRKVQERDYFIDGGLGYSWKLNPYVKCYSMLHLSIHSTKQYYRVSPTLGVFLNYDRFRADITYKKENVYNKKNFEGQYNIKVQQLLNDDTSLYASFEKYEKTNILSFGLKWHF